MDVKQDSILSAQREHNGRAAFAGGNLDHHLRTSGAALASQRTFPPALPDYPSSVACHASFNSSMAMQPSILKGLEELVAKYGKVIGFFYRGRHADVHTTDYALAN